MRKRRFCLLLAGLLILLPACGQQNGQPVSEPADGAGSYGDEISGGQQDLALVRFTDGLGRQVEVQQPQRVAAVMGSFAQTWLLAGGKLAAVTQDALDERDLELDGSTANLGAMKSPDVEQMLALDVDFVILSANVAEHVKLQETLEAAGIAAAYFDVETFDEYLDMLKICTDITGRADLYEQNGTAVQEQIDRAVGKSQGKPQPKVLFIRAYSTGAKAKGSDSMTGTMLKELGCVNIADQDAGLLEDLSMEEIIRQDPDFIFVTTMGASDEKAMEALAQGIQSNPAWAELTAVKEGRYILLPKELFHNKPNNRWGESYEILAEYLYGEKTE
ncbi:MAG: ABC transporter substrate-binding protein [Oscillospiraceae bacterium]|nr:ABC transporter substrate-binding protein [Oscillospiraceae bacterium]